MSPTHGRAPYHLTPADRFWLAVEKTETCWLFRAVRYTRSGHASISVQGRLIGAHRFAYELLVGPIPEGKWVLHTCDVGRCVRPQHLYLGDVVRNNLDRDERGRHVALPGSANGNAALTEDDVAVARVLLLQGGSQARIAEGLGVSKAAIQMVAAGHTWQHVDLWQPCGVPA